MVGSVDQNRWKHSICFVQTGIEVWSQVIFWFRKYYSCFYLGAYSLNLQPCIEGICTRWCSYVGLHAMAVSASQKSHSPLPLEVSMQSLLKFTATTRTEVGPRQLLAVSGYLRFPSPRASWWSPARQGRWEPPQAWEAVFFLKSQSMQSSPSELDGRELKRNCYTIRPQFSASSESSQENKKDSLQRPTLPYLTPPVPPYPFLLPIPSRLHTSLPTPAHLAGSAAGCWAAWGHRQSRLLALLALQNSSGGGMDARELWAGSGPRPPPEHCPGKRLSCCRGPGGPHTAGTRRPAWCQSSVCSERILQQTKTRGLLSGTEMASVVKWKQSSSVDKRFFQDCCFKLRSEFTSWPNTTSSVQLSCFTVNCNSCPPTGTEWGHRYNTNQQFCTGTAVCHKAQLAPWTAAWDSNLPFPFTLQYFTV